MSKPIYFYIGTEAEFIKVFPVIKACHDRNANIKIIASGQNDISKSRIWEALPYKSADLQLSDEKNIKKSAAGLFNWFASTYRSAPDKIKVAFGIENLKNAPLAVHGDTVSTYMGALIGRKLGMSVCHIEAGLRSHHLFNPFPEEIDRLLTSRIAKYHFAPGNEPANNLKKAKGHVINTHYNTIIDSLSISEDMQIKSAEIENLQNTAYFVYVMHRQENLMKKDFFINCLNEVISLSEKMHCVMILHTPTKIALDETGYIDKLQNNDNFTLLKRADYFDFMKLLKNSQFVITDGGSNQEELSYMGKPTLIMRKTTERNDGLGQNAHLYDNDIGSISKMADIFHTWEREVIIPKLSPSEIIADCLLKI